MQDPVLLDYTIKGMMLVLMLSMPAIILATLAGLSVSVLQALTQIQEQTLGFAIKLIVVIITLLLTANFIAAELYHYSLELFNNFPSLVR